MVHRAYTRDVFDGAKPEKVEDFQAEFPHTSYEHFAHMTSVVRIGETCVPLPPCLAVQVVGPTKHGSAMISAAVFVAFCAK